MESSLGRLLERLGSTLLSLEAGRVDAARAVTSVVLYDPSDPPVVTDGSLVLGVGIVGSDELLERIGEFGATGAAALVVREPVPMSAEVRAAAEQAGIAVFGLVRGASWIQIATILATMLGSALSMDSTRDAPLTVDAGADLFELANSLAALLQAPITIEDLSSRVVAFSADQAGTDEGRRLTILGLQVPEVYSDVVRSRGVFRQVYTSERPVFMEQAEQGGLPRVAMRVKAGEEMLGSIWAVVQEPLTPQREQGMVEAARVVAMTMLRARVAADSTQRLRVGLVSMLLEGGTRAREAAQQLNFGSSAACVIAIGAGGVSTDGVSSRGMSTDEVRSESETQRTAAALSMYLQPIYPRAIAALLGSVIYAVIPLRAADAVAASEGERLAREFIGRLDTADTLYAGVGRVVSEITELTESRREADAALRVLRSRQDTRSRVSTLAAVQVDAIMLRIADSLAADRVRPTGSLALLSAYDAEHGTDLVPTLRSWLDHFGDVAAASMAVHVHKNTFRYRLGRLADVGGIDLDDADTRFGLMLQLRLFDL